MTTLPSWVQRENSLGRWIPSTLSWKNPCLHTGEGGQSPGRNSSSTDNNRPFLPWGHSKQWWQHLPVTPSHHTEGISDNIFPCEGKTSSTQSFVFARCLSCYQSSGIGLGFGLGAGGVSHHSTGQSQGEVDLNYKHQKVGKNTWCLLLLWQKTENSHMKNTKRSKSSLNWKKVWLVWVMREVKQPDEGL